MCRATQVKTAAVASSAQGAPKLPAKRLPTSQKPVAPAGLLSATTMTAATRTKNLERRRHQPFDTASKPTGGKDGSARTSRNWISIVSRSLARVGNSFFHARIARTSNASVISSPAWHNTHWTRTHHLSNPSILPVTGRCDQTVRSTLFATAAVHLMMFVRVRN